MEVKFTTDWFKGKRTYIMIFVDAIDQVGIAEGWWAADQLRHVVEFAFTAIFLRMGVESSGPAK